MQGALLGRKSLKALRGEQGRDTLMALGQIPAGDFSFREYGPASAASRKKVAKSPSGL